MTIVALTPAFLVHRGRATDLQHQLQERGAASPDQEAVQAGERWSVVYSLTEYFIQIYS